MHEVEANMYLSDKEGIWAFGKVTVDRCIQFPVQMRKYQNQNGERTSFISFPRQKRKNGWEDVVHPDKELRQEIISAVGEAIKKEMSKDLYLPDIESVEVTPLNPVRYPSDAKAKICGLATVRLCGMTIRGITIKQGARGLFVNMPQYKNSEGAYKDAAYGTSRAMRDKINQAVLDTYREITAK